MQYCYDYSIELENMLKKVYENKIYKIAKENNIDNINESNLNSIISIFKSTHVYMGSDLDDFIINLMPTGDAGYFYRVEISKHFNYTYPRLFDHLGNPLKNPRCNSYALRLWEANMEEIFIEDIHSKFNKENFDKFVENNLLNMSKDLVSYVKNANQNKDLIIPIKDKSELLSSIKSMVLSKKLDSSWIELLVDIDILREEMEKYSATFEMYNEFDKLEDSLEECIDNFPKYTSEELYNILTNQEGFNFVENIGLIKNI